MKLAKSAFVCFSTITSGLEEVNPSVKEEDGEIFLLADTRLYLDLVLLLLPHTGGAVKPYWITCSQTYPQLSETVSAPGFRLPGH